MPRKKADSLVEVTSALDMRPQAHVTTSAGRVKVGEYVSIPEEEAAEMISSGLLRAVEPGEADEADQGDEADE